MRPRIPSIVLSVVLCFAAVGVLAADLVVHVDGVPDDVGTVSCGLYTDEAGFPDDVRTARTQQQPAQRDGTVCRYADVPAGRAAVAVSHDRNGNGNGRLDKNFLGIPREPWGVSNGVRPSLRPPRYAEAAFDVPADGVLEIRVAVAE